MVGGITRLSERMTRILATLYHIDTFTSGYVCVQNRERLRVEGQVRERWGRHTETETETERETHRETEREADRQTDT